MTFRKPAFHPLWECLPRLDCPPGVRGGGGRKLEVQSWAEPWSCQSLCPHSPPRCTSCQRPSAPRPPAQPAQSPTSHPAPELLRGLFQGVCSLLTAKSGLLELLGRLPDNVRENPPREWVSTSSLALQPGRRVGVLRPFSSRRTGGLGTNAYSGRLDAFAQQPSSALHGASWEALE